MPANMLRPILRQAARHSIAASQRTTMARPSLITTTTNAARYIHNVPPRREAKPGSYSRTDPDVEVEYPEDHELPSSKPVHGTGGQYVKPTLGSFSLDGRVGLVTGGARGLGLVMGQGMVYSGADLALVDMNKEEAEKQTKLLTDAFKRENPNAAK